MTSTRTSLPRAMARRTSVFLSGTILALAASLVVASVAGAQPMTGDQQSCTNALDKNFAKTTSTVGKEMCKCIKDVAKGRATGPACVGRDPKGKVVKASAKTRAAYLDGCLGTDNGATGIPSFGTSDAGTVHQTALGTDETLLVDTLFGSDLGPALSAGIGDKALAKCQQAVAKSVKKCHDTRVKEFGKCKKKALSGGADTSAAVAACFGDDPKDKIAKTCNLTGAKPDKIRKTLDKKCAGIDLTVAFPRCATSDAEQLHACLDAPTRCLGCQQVADTSGLVRDLDCDTFDNASADGSCVIVRGEKIDIIDNGVEPAETPGTPGVTVTNGDLITQFGGTDFSLNISSYTRWRPVGPDQQPDAILIVISGFGGGANQFLTMAQDLIPRMLADKGLRLEVWGFHLRSHPLEDREGSLIGIAAADPLIGLDWYYGGDLALDLHPALVAGPNRRAAFYNAHDDIPFLANWTTQVMSRDLDVVVEEARTLAANQNVFMGGHSAGTGFTARYAATDFNLTGAGDPDPGYAKLRGLVMFEGNGGNTSGDPLSEDSLDRIIAKADGGLFGAVRDDAPRCVDGTTPCTIETEATDCSGQIPPKCTLPTSAYGAVQGLGPEVGAASEVLAAQAMTDPDSGLSILQADQGEAGNSAANKVPGLSLLGLLPLSTVEGFMGATLDDDGLLAGFSPSAATSLGGPSGGQYQSWQDITEGPLPGTLTPDNGPAPTDLNFTSFQDAQWGQEKETVRIDRLRDSFTDSGTNASDWYYATSGLSVTSASGLCDTGGGTCTAGNVGAACTDNGDCGQSISLDSSALSIGRGRRDIVNLTQAGNIDIPVICFGGSNGLTTVPGVYLPLADSLATCTAPSCDGATPRVVDAALPNEAFPTFGDIAGGYEVHISEGFTHVDVVAAEDIPDNNVLPALSDFITRNAQ